MNIHLHNNSTIIVTNDNIRWDCKDGPTYITNYHLEWHEDGVLYNSNGPSTISLNRKGQIFDKGYTNKEGKYVPKEDYELERKRLNDTNNIIS